MRRVAPLAAVLLACLAGLALGGAAVEEGLKVRIPFYDPDTGDLLYVLEAAKVAPAQADPKLLEGTSIRITAYHKGQTHVVTAKAGVVHTETRDASLKGDVVVTFGDPQATRVRTQQLHWYGETGLGTTEPPARQGPKPTHQRLEQAVAKSTISVEITRPDLTTEGMGLLFYLRDTKAAGKQPDRTHHLLIGRRVRTVVRSTSAGALLHGQGGPSPATSPTPKGPPSKPPDQPNPAPGTRRPVVITCTGPLSLHRQAMSAVYRDNVRVVQADRSVTCDRLTIAFRQLDDPNAKAKGKFDLHRVIAQGHVRIDDGTNIALADRAAWSFDAARAVLAVLTGRPASLTQDNRREIAAGRIQLKARRIEAPGGGVTYQFEWLDCDPTPECPQSVYLHTFAPLARTPPTPAER